MVDATIDDSAFQKGMADLLGKVPENIKGAVHDVASEVLRLSQQEVPHDIGTLQNSGSVEDEDEQSIVGYHTPYAARLHEHPEYRFNKGRKGKYLEDPIKNNLQLFIQYFKNVLK